VIAIQNLIFGFIFSFIGSIPPGSLNLSVIQLSLQRNVGAAIRFGFAAAFVEFFYATIAIKLQMYISSSPAIQSNFKLISASVLVILGVVNLVSIKAKPKKKGVIRSIAFSGFRRGILLSIANPLAMPFWIVVTAYLQSKGWVNLIEVPIWSYVVGISFGTLSLLIVLALTAYKSSKFINKDNKYIKLIPGLVLLGLGLYSLGELLLA
jgi:threonine/homoserine/homoserine lactone efflux protein